MNFPITQRTGRLAELKVEAVFTSWSWTVGKDLIDTGYDFFVQPDVTTFKGHRFLVQVKATTRSKNGRVAKVSKERLREYANNPLPVFLVWSSNEGVLHWLHIQPWIRQNIKRISGSGDAGVKLPTNQTLDDKEAFTAYLAEILKPLAESNTALLDLAQERSHYLSSIDPRLGVRVGVNEGKECYEIFANAEPTTLEFEIKPSKDQKGPNGVAEAIRYGLPISIEADAFSMRGSKLFDVIGMGRARGTLVIQPLATRFCTIIMRPGTEYSMLVPTYSVRATQYFGSGGGAVSNEGSDDVLELNIRVDLDEIGKFRTNSTLSLRRERIGGGAIQNLDCLGQLGDWAEETLRRKSFYLDMSFEGIAGRVPLIAAGEQFESMSPLLYHLSALGRLQKVAKALNSDLMLENDFELSDQDIAAIDFAYGLLKGENITIKNKNIEFTANDPIVLEFKGVFRITCTLTLTVSGKRLGDIPVAIVLNRYKLEPTPTPLRYRLVEDADGECNIHYDDQGNADAITTTSVAKT